MRMRRNERWSALSLFTTLMLPSALLGQQTTKQVGAAPQGSCIVLKRMGPADEVTSHLYSFGIRGKQFQFVEGQLPEGVKFHGRLTDHDVRKIQDAGGRVAIVDAHYTDQELEQARRTCGLSGSATAPSAGTPKEPKENPDPPTTAASQPAVQSESKALGKADILDLLKGEVPNARVIELVKHRGIKFAPTEDDYKEIRAAGGGDDLVNVLKAAALMRE